MTALLAVSCGRKTGDGPTVSRFDGFTQGTTYHILVKSDGPLHMENEIDSLLTEVDNSMSLYNPQSLLSRLNRNETDSVDGFIAECIRTARRISEQSDGAYDITVKPLTAAYGFTGDVPVQNPDVDSLLKLVGYDKIAVENGRLRKADPRMQIDLNSIAQGATSDYIAAYFEKLGIEEYMIEVGGEIFCRGLNAKGKIKEVGKGDMFNPFIGLLKAGYGTLAYRDEWNLFDNIIVSENLATGSTGSLKIQPAGNSKFYGGIFRRPYMIQKEGQYKGYPLRTFVGNDFQGGFSDHFPVYIYIAK